MSRIDDMAMDISVIMPAIARRLLLSFFQEENISQSQLLTVMAIKELEQCRLSDLSQVMGISDPTASGLVDRLHKSGYVQREHDQDDRRALVITLSRKGERLAEKFRKTAAEKWVVILKKLSDQDRKNFIRILTDIRASI